MLEESFYQQHDTLRIARELLGKTLISSLGIQTGGIIIETEAYCGAEDRACHAFGYRRTVRNEMMYAAGGIAYVYQCYGIHFLLNVVTHSKDTPHAILIRALHPTIGIEEMKKRRKGQKLLCGGPGTVCQALGIDKSHNGISLQGPHLWIEDHGLHLDCEIGPRIGVEYAGKDALLPYRFKSTNVQQKTF